MRRISAIDLFCGVGGLTHGLRLSGINVTAGVDIDKTCEFAYSQNNQGAAFIAKDLKNLSSDELAEMYPNDTIKILAGCAPCQPFSALNIAGKKGNTSELDERWSLLGEFGTKIEELQPDIVSMENVPQLTKHKIYHEFVSLLKKNGYFVEAKIVNCADYGVPQRRKRLVLLASKHGKISLIPATHIGTHVSIKDIIAELPTIEHGEICETDVLHAAPKLSPINEKRIIASKQGGTWKSWDDDLKLDCHKKLTGESYIDSYGRMSWNLPAPTLTTKCTGIGNGRFGHPEQNRTISLREAALLQSFPKDYLFIPKDTQKIPFTQISRHIGNAVPVLLGKVIGESIIKHLNELHNEPKI